MTLLSFWPTINEINECIKPEAETAHEALLLAVHQTIPIQKKSVAGGHSYDASEAELVDYFCTPNLPTGTMIMPIIGSSGSGKSHIIRWLESQLKFRDTSKKFHIIRIPKSASLRSVVEMVLEPLQGEQYDKLRNDLQTAAAETTSETAIIQLRAGIENALRDKENELKHEERSPQIALMIGHTINLQVLFNDAELVQHFSKKVFPKLITRALSGRIADAVDADVLPQFEPDDLKLPSDLEINHAAHRVRLYYQTQLSTADGRQLAASILNSVLDRAIGFAFQLSGYLGGMTLQDLVLQIRKQLLREDKELILLIEDFVALAGIQSTILEMAIKEAIHDGKKDYCVMRTAIAVTTGLAGRETIRTRAQFEWEIKENISSLEQIESLVVDLVGSYLNAARYGYIQTINIYERIRLDKDCEELIGWLKPFASEETDSDTIDMLNVFGKSSREHWLFPFNRQMIRQLMERYLKEGNSLTFNPRTVINRILRDTLLLRHDFEIQAFPHPDFAQGTASACAFVSQFVKEKVQQDERERYKCFLSLWGGNPSDKSQLEGIFPLLFKAFNLKNILEGIPITSSTPASKPEPVVFPPTQPGQWQDLLERSEAWKSMLEKWNQGTQMPQPDANKIRQHLEWAVSSYINWNQLCMSDRKVPYTLFSIPHSRGDRGGPIKIAEDNSDSEGNLRMALTALFRYEEAKYSWNYPGGENDVPYYAHLLEDLANKAVQYITSSVESELVPLIQGLYVGSHVIGASSVSSKNADKIIGTITCALPPKVLSKGLDDSWDIFTERVYASWSNLQKAFFERCACYQGSGSKEFGVHYPMLASIISRISFYEKIEPVSIIVDLLPAGGKVELKPVLQQLTNDNIFKSRVRKLFEHVTQLTTDITKYLGNNFDKSALLESLKANIKTTAEAGLWPDRVKSLDELKTLARNFEESSIKDTIDKIRTLNTKYQEEQIPSYVPVCGLINAADLTITKAFLYDFDQFLSALQKKLDSMIEQLEENDYATATEEVLQQLEQLGKNLQALSGERQ